MDLTARPQPIDRHGTTSGMDYLRFIAVIDPVY
jgi:hypothetical protein